MHSQQLARPVTPAPKPVATATPKQVAAKELDRQHRDRFDGLYNRLLDAIAAGRSRTAHHVLDQMLTLIDEVTA